MIVPAPEGIPPIHSEKIAEEHRRIPMDYCNLLPIFLSTYFTILEGGIETMCDV